MLVKKTLFISPLYLFQVISQIINIYAARSSQSNNIPSFKIWQNLFKDSFFSADIFLSLMFKKELFKFFRPEPNLTYKICDIEGLQDCDCDSSIWLITNSVTTFKTVYALCIHAVRSLKQQITFYFTAQIITVQENPLSKKYIKVVITL